MKRIILLCLLALFMFSCESEVPREKLSFTISQTIFENEPALKVKMTLNKGKEGITKLSYKDQAWGEDSLHNVLKRLEIMEGGTVEMDRDSGWVTLRHDTMDKLLQLEYIIQQDTDSVIDTRDVYRPIITDEYFQLFGHHLFMVPIAATEDQAFDVEINWDMDESVTLQNSFGGGQNDQLIDNVTLDQFLTSNFVGGDFRRYEFDLEGNKVSFAIRDQWQQFDDSTMVAVLKETMKAQRDFWKDHSQPYFSVTMIPTVQERGSSFQGTGLTHSFATAASNNEYLEVEGLVYLLNHELQHNWTGSKIKNENEEEQYWFSEGFTDYYTWKNIAQNNIYGLDGSFFIDELNKVIKALYASPVKEAPNSEITYDNFWADRAYAKLPYQRGAIFAFYLDSRIQRDSHGEESLDNLMLDFLDTADHKISNQFFIEKANKYLNEDLTPFFNRHIEEGQLFDLAAIFDALELEHSNTATVFELGIKWDEQNQTIVEIVPGSNAEKAGMQIGDKVIGRSYYYDQPEFEASFTVLRNDQEIDFSYLPATTAAIPLLMQTEENAGLLGYELADQSTSAVGAPSTIN